MRCAPGFIAVAMAAVGVADGEHVAQAKDYFIDIGVKAEQDLIRKVGSVETGSTVELVIQMLGQPHVDKKLVTKRGVFVTRRLQYYSKKLSKDLVNENEDRYVALDFDATNRLTAKFAKLGLYDRHPL
jgi:hypothetical protein